MIQSILESAAGINPLFIIIGFTLIYLLATVARREALNLAFVGWSAICLLMIFSAGGKAVTAETQMMTETVPRARCALDAAIAGAYLDPRKLKDAEHCSVGGSGFPASTDPSLAKRMISGEQLDTP